MPPCLRALRSMLLSDWALSSVEMLQPWLNQCPLRSCPAKWPSNSMKTTIKSPGPGLLFPVCKCSDLPNERSCNPHRHDHVPCAAVGIIVDESVRPGYVEELEPDMVAHIIQHRSVLSFISLSG